MVIVIIIMNHTNVINAINVYYIQYWQIFHNLNEIGIAEYAITHTHTRDEMM